MQTEKGREHGGPSHPVPCQAGVCQDGFAGLARQTGRTSVGVWNKKKAEK
jgi:hypothetical protein